MRALGTSLYLKSAGRPWPALRARPLPTPIRGCGAARGRSPEATSVSQEARHPWRAVDDEYSHWEQRIARDAR